MENRESIDLAILSVGKLKQIMRERLHGYDAGGPALDCRGDIPAHQWLTDCYKKGDVALRQHIDEIIADFLDDAVIHDSWPKHARNALFVLAQSSGGEATINKLHELLEKYPAYLLGKNFAASLLKCLIAHECLETIEYWLE